MQVKQPAKVYPVMVVGTGASGGMAAWNLTRQGIDVVLLDAGEKFDSAKFWTHVTPWEARERRRARRAARLRSCSTPRSSRTSTPDDRPFELIAGVGPRRQDQRLGACQPALQRARFPAPARDGWEIPWPIHYSDVAPYYDKVDQLIGVCGGDDDYEVLPGSRYHLPPPRRGAPSGSCRGRGHAGMPFVPAAAPT